MTIVQPTIATTFSANLQLKPVSVNASMKTEEKAKEPKAADGTTAG